MYDDEAVLKYTKNNKSPFNIFQMQQLIHVILIKAAASNKGSGIIQEILNFYKSSVVVQNVDQFPMLTFCNQPITMIRQFINDSNHTIYYSKFERELYDAKWETLILNNNKSESDNAISNGGNPDELGNGEVQGGGSEIILPYDVTALIEGCINYT